MVFQVKYDPASNVNFVKCVKKYPYIYKNNFSATDKERATLAWEEVAQELNSTASYCRFRWTNIIGCYKRYLRHKAGNTVKRPYYLAEEMEFVKPYLRIPVQDRNKKQTKTAGTNEPATHTDEEIAFEEIDLSSHTVKMEECNDFPINPMCIIVDSSDDEQTMFETSPAGSESSLHELSGGNSDITTNSEEENPDFCFFRSLLPDIRLMSAQQKLKFRKALLNAVDMTLYGEDLKNILLISPNSECSIK